MTATQTNIFSFPEAEIGLVEAYLRGLPSSATREVYKQVIRDFEVFLGCDLLVVTRRQVEAYRSHLEAQGRAAATVSKHLSALSGYYDFALDEGAIVKTPMSGARRPKVRDTSPRRSLSQAEVHSLLAVPNAGTLVGLRDLALLSVLVAQGWRISEALGLRVEDLDEDQGHKVATITGKGSKVARVTLAGATSDALATWTEAAGITSGPVFVPVLKGGHVLAGRPISSQSAWKRIKYLAEQAGFTRVVHPHIFRHTAITVALAAGVPLHQVQDFARHADPRTTRRYDSNRLSLQNPACHILAARLIPEREHVGGNPPQP